MHEVVQTQQSLSVNKVALFEEKELVLQRSRKLQELKTLKIQNQRRITELLVRTDPNRSKHEIKGRRLARGAAFGRAGMRGSGQYP